MSKIFIFLSFLSINSFAEEIHPTAPLGWVEMHSIEPVILTWVKASPDKELDEVPAFMVQKFKKDEKFKRFISSHKLDSSSCFELLNKEWHQTWCVKEKHVYALLSKGEDRPLKETLKKWVLSHD